MDLLCAMQRALAYLRYRLRAKGIHRAHSPFLFGLFEEVFNDEKFYYAFDAIERERKRRWNDKRSIQIEDLGAGSRILKGQEREIASIARHSAKRPKYARMLFRLIQQQRHQRVLELGTSLGLTTAYLAAAANEVISVEGSSALVDEAKGTLERTKQSAEIVQMAFDDYLQTLDQTQKFDLIFIDGHHEGEALLNYFTQLKPYLSDEGCFVIDDINWSADMQRAWQALIKDVDFTMKLDLFELGLLFRREGMVPQYHQIRY